MSKSLMAELVRRCAAAESGQDLFVDGVIKNLASLKVCVFRHTGYAARIDSIAAYFQHQMELLRPSVWQELFSAMELFIPRSRTKRPLNTRSRR